MGQEEALPPLPAVAFSWEHEQGVLKPASGPAAGVRGMPPESQRKAPKPATVVLPWEQEPVVKPRGVPDSAKKVPALARRLSVPPPPGRPSTRSVSRAVRPEEDPFLAAYLACTKSTGGPGGDGKRAAKCQRRSAWSRLGLGALSCKRGNGVVEQSIVRVAKLPEVDPTDALID